MGRRVSNEFIKLENWLSLISGNKFANRGLKLLVCFHKAQTSESFVRGFYDIGHFAVSFVRSCTGNKESNLEYFAYFVVSVGADQKAPFADLETCCKTQVSLIEAGDGTRVRAPRVTTTSLLIRPLLGLTVGLRAGLVHLLVPSVVRSVLRSLSAQRTPFGDNYRKILTVPEIF